MNATKEHSLVDMLDTLNDDSTLLKQVAERIGVNGDIEQIVEHLNDGSAKTRLRHLYEFVKAMHDPDGSVDLAMLGPQLRERPLRGPHDFDEDDETQVALMTDVHRQLYEFLLELRHIADHAELSAKCRTEARHVDEVVSDLEDWVERWLETFRAHLVGDEASDGDDAVETSDDDEMHVPVLSELRDLLEVVDNMMEQDANVWSGPEMLDTIDSRVKGMDWFDEVRRDGEDPYAPPLDHEMSYVHDVGDIRSDIDNLISNAESRMKDSDPPTREQMHEWLTWRLRESWWVRAVVTGNLGDRLEDLEEVAG